MLSTSYQSDLSDASDIGHGHRTDAQGGVRLKTGRTDTAPGMDSVRPTPDRTANPFYARLAERQQRQRLGGQHSAPPTDDVYAVYERHCTKGNTLAAARLEQLVMLAAFERERAEVAGRQAVAF